MGLPHGSQSGGLNPGSVAAVYSPPGLAGLLGGAQMDVALTGSLGRQD